MTYGADQPGSDAAAPPSPSWAADQRERERMREENGEAEQIRFCGDHAREWSQRDLSRW